ncbi:IS5 family transposase, partial [Novosphingobium sp.]|uniref:IS5 family transposase n=1 Tax=Novosphingobium sp. TaxID=1874826 RepID=UPI002FE361A0
MPKPTPAQYRTTNWPAYNAALKRRGSQEVWLDPAMAWFAVPDGRAGRPLRFSDEAIEFCLTLKVLFRLPLRQVTGLVESLLRMAGLDWPVPDYTTLCRRQRTLSVDLGRRSSADGLHLLVDSTGIKMMGEGEWKTRKHGASRRRQWRKVHIGIDARTLDIRAIEVTTNAVCVFRKVPDSDSGKSRTVI